MKSKPPKGQNVTITRAHIALRQAERSRLLLEPLTDRQIAEEFIRVPEARHYARAYRLMARRLQEAPRTREAQA